MNETDAAVAHLREGLAICERDGLVSTRSFIFSNLADAAFKSDDMAAAESHANQAIAIATAVGNRAVTAGMRTLLAMIALRRGDADSARSAVAEALTLAIEIASPAMMLEPVDPVCRVAQGPRRIIGRTASTGDRRCASGNDPADTQRDSRARSRAA